MPVGLGLDSSVLSPFARAGRLDALERITVGHRRVVTRAVLDELERGAMDYPALAHVKELSWLEVVPVDSLDSLDAFHRYVRALGHDSRNIGEASLLAWAELSAGVAVIDDATAVAVARSRGVTVRRSLALAVDALHRRRGGGSTPRRLAG